MTLTLFTLDFFFNGESYTVQTSKLFTLKDLIQFFDFNKSVVIIEYNGKISNPKQWSSIKLKNGDRLEIVTIVGGG